jgi:translation initiation factor IF-2
MSETTDKPKLGARAPLGIKRTIEAGQVKQSFSHGRSNTVVVEVKKARTLRRPGEEAPKVEVAAPPPPPPPPAPVARAPQPPAPAQQQRPVPNDPAARRELQARLLREAEEARLTSLEEARRREDREAQQSTVDERRRAEDNRRAEEEAAEAARRAEEEARKAAETRAAEPASETSAGAPAAGSSAAEDERRPVRFTPVKRPEPPARPVRGRDDRRQSGKLTVTRALDDGDGARARSLAALRRAREKDKRHHQQSGPSAKQVRDVIVPDAITVQELANRMAERGSDLVKSLFKMGMPVTITETIDQDTAELLVTEFGHNIKRVSESDADIQTETDLDADETMLPRPPWSRSWAMSTTARRPCSTRSAAPP